MRKKMILLLLIAAVVVAAVGGYLWNKPRPKAEDQAGLATTAEALYAAYAANETAANATYLDKVIRVRGNLVEISRNQDGRQVLLLGVADPLGGVQCTLREEQPAYQINQPVEIKGFCNGFTTVVVLSDCVPSKP